MITSPAPVAFSVIPELPRAKVAPAVAVGGVDGIVTLCQLLPSGLVGCGKAAFCGCGSAYNRWGTESAHWSVPRRCLGGTKPDIIAGPRARPMGGIARTPCSVAPRANKNRDARTALLSSRRNKVASGSLSRMDIKHSLSVPGNYLAPYRKSARHPGKDRRR
jgi:hypothetical protein